MITSILEIIENRRSVFPSAYNEEPITRAEIELILKAANWAPTHKRTEPWRFKVLHGASQEQFAQFLADTYKKHAAKFSEFKYNKLLANPVKAGAIVLICMQRDEKERVPLWEEIAATGMAVQNMWLQAHEMQIGAYWSSPDLAAYMDEFCEMNDGEQCLGFFYMGKYNEPLQEGVRHSSIEEKTTWL